MSEEQEQHEGASLRVCARREIKSQHSTNPHRLDRIKHQIKAKTIQFPHSLDRSKAIAIQHAPNRLFPESKPTQSNSHTSST
eukprot:2499754-Rhodomonas_salina.1